ncbi:hypothetical protein LCGC14_2078460 [marine sediment metagenome]|uniref:Uncharacterized protein n=1 Tax=marine sediment metagenome TaxID=412755 RepID=A0A0F9EG50_9ZZZZ
MALEKQIVYRQQIDEFGNINVQKVEQILEDGEVHSEKYHRHVVAPGEEAKDEDAVTKEIAKVVHTPEVIAAYEARIAESQIE